MTIAEAAQAVGATILGDPPHYLMTAEQLERFVALLRMPALPCRLLRWLW